jgi:hypothetical protein
MQFWPKVTFPSSSRQPTASTFTLEGAYPDEFSFYHFILNKSSSPYSSSVCSAALIGEDLGITLSSIQGLLVNWCGKKKANPNLKPPSMTLKMPLVPGAIYQHGLYYKWNLLAKPFTQFLLDAAYLYVGTQHKAALNLAFLRFPTILALKVVGGSEGREFRNRSTDIYRFRKEKDERSLFFR